MSSSHDKKTILDFFLPRLKLTYRTAHVEVEDREDWEIVKRTVDFLFKSQKDKESSDKKS
jgi:hypothetical protein